LIIATDTTDTKLARTLHLDRHRSVFLTPIFLTPIFFHTERKSPPTVTPIDIIDIARTSPIDIIDTQACLRQFRYRYSSCLHRHRFQHQMRNNRRNNRRHRQSPGPKPVVLRPAFALAFAFAFTRLEALWYSDVRLVMRTSTEDAGDNNTGDSERFLSFFGVFRRGAGFLAAGCVAAGGRLVCFLLGGIGWQLFRVRCPSKQDEYRYQWRWRFAFGSVSNRYWYWWRFVSIEVSR